jgi:molybdopterin-guanine dinucleotide biosynthesis protein B
VLPIVCIVGHSGAGKTTLVERLIGELRRRGIRVAALKHTRDDFDMDRSGKDTWRYSQAGCESVAILGRERYAVLKHHRRDAPLEEVLPILGADADLVVVEGLHEGAAPKIEVHRAALERELRCKAEELVAVVTDEPLEIGCRQFSPDQVGALATFLEEEIMAPAAGGTALAVNGKPVSLGSFTQRIIASTLLGMVSALKGIGRIRTISVSIRTQGGVPDNREGDGS